MRSSQIITICFISLTIGLMQGCVRSHTVKANQSGDASLGCQDLAVRLGELAAVKRLAQRQSGLSGENIVAGLFLWENAANNADNSRETIASVNARSQVLEQRYAAANCQTQRVVFSEEQIREKLKQGNTRENFRRS